MNFNKIIVYLSIYISFLTATCINFSNLTQLWIIPITFLAAFVALHLIFWVFIIMISFTVSVKKDYEKPSAFYHFVLNCGYKYLCSCAGINLTVFGIEKVPENKPFLLISNHLSRFDNMVQSMVLEKYNIAYISKPSNLKIPIARKYIKRNLYMSIDRDNPRNAMKTIKKAQQLINNNVTSIGVFPEGRRSKDYKLQDFKPGCFKIATKTGCPILVTAVQGTQNIHKNFPFKRTNVTFDILDVIYPNGKKTIELSDSIHSKLQKHLESQKEKI